jgi:hypothetical protein
MESENMHAFGTNRTRAAMTTTVLFKDNPRQIVTNLLVENPKASKQELFPKFQKLITSKGLRRAIDWYFFANMFDYIARTRNDKPSKREQITQQVEELKNRVVAVVLLDLFLPNGKLLRDASGAECTKAGGFFAEIGKRIAPRNIVGNVLSESELQATWKKLAS